MNRPTIALCCIMKDEIKHIKPLLESVKDCFDEIHLTDTGSTDGTLEFARDFGDKIAGCPVHVRTFTWIDDFAAARNHSMKDVKTDYVMWLDLDDALSSREDFIRWRDEVMLLADFWLAPYHYAFDNEGRPICTFLRERVIKTKKKFSWRYFIHEGMIADEPVGAQVASNWAVNHRRTKEDYEKDFSRNVSILEKNAKTGELPVRLKFYYGKELCDKGRFQEGYVWLDQICDNPQLEGHDRILTFEYLVRACLHRYFQEEEHKPERQKNKALIAKALGMACQGIALAPNRAEFYCLAGDALVKMGREPEALPMYGAAASCKKALNQSTGFLFINHPAYEHIPLDMMARIKFKMGDLDSAIVHGKESVSKFNHEESKVMLSEFLNLKEKLDKHSTTKKVKTDDVVFTCMHGSHPYQFDEEIYASKGIGGSETALVEVAKHVKKITGRNVIVFNSRESEKVCASGVVYKPALQMYEYFTEYEPKAHFAWRHNIKLTDAPTFLWCHDLTTNGADVSANYNGIICLSDFHKNYVRIMQGIPENKIVVSRNGVNKERFLNEVKKNENKIIWPSSLDRGIERAIDIIELAREKSGKDLELHVFYGIESMMNDWLRDKAVMIKQKMDARPWVKYHGNVDQLRLAKEFQESVVWLYPASFIETYCISALESMYAKCVPLVRELGGLKNTVKPFEKKGWAKILFRDADTKEDQQVWADELLDILEKRTWENIDMSEFNYSWAGVAQHFIEFSGLKGQVMRDAAEELSF